MNEAALLEKYELETLSGANLSECDFRGCDLSGADLSKADLFNTNLSGANLSGANLSGVNLSWANLSGANLSGANISRAKLSRVNLSGADLSKVNLDESILSSSCLSKADLSGADLTDCDLSGVNLYGASLFRTDLTDTNLLDANLFGVLGLASMQEEMEMLILLREAIRQESFEFDMDDWHERESPDKSSFESFLNTCGTTHCGRGFCQKKLAEEGNPIALTSAAVAGSYAIPSMAWLFSCEKEEFIEHLDDLISGKEPLLQR